MRVFVVLVLSSLFTHAQIQNSTGVVEGIVTGESGEPLLGATVIIKNTTKGVATDFNGRFKIDELVPENYTLKISSISYKTQEIPIQISSSKLLNVNIILVEDASQLDQVVVRGKTKADIVREQTFAVNSIETKRFANVTTDVNQILNQTSGVQLKQTGGLGSKFQFYLNGLSGNQIRFFVDEIPVDILGSTFNLNNVVPNLVDRIDVYKGVVPIYLGSDALGGSVNVITDKTVDSFLDASYSLGAFNTHRFALNSKHRFSKSGLTLKMTSFYNESDNDYTMYGVEFFNEDGQEVIEDVKRFHDDYQSSMINLGLGFTKKKWADELMAQVYFGEVNQDIQTNFRGTVNGEAKSFETNKTGSFRYKKSKLLNNKFDVDIYTLYNEIITKEVDTSSYRYSWDGSKRINISGGELDYTQKAIYEFDRSNFLYRINTGYKLAKNHKVSLNHIHSKTTQQGFNTLNISGNNVFALPSTLKKDVTGLAYEGNFFKQKLETYCAIKNYFFNINSRKARQATDAFTFVYEDITNEQQNLGYLSSFKYSILPNWFVKTSYERGYRLPEANEIFGNGFTTVANPELVPENSNNINLGTNFNIAQGQLSNQLNVFYRDTENFIRITDGGRASQYENTFKVLIKGFDYDISYLKNNFRINANFTYQQVLNNVKYPTGSTTVSFVYRQQLPQTPSFFGSFSFNYNFDSLLKRINLSAFYSANYVQEYYLTYPNVSLLTYKNIIPTQFVNNLGVTTSSKDNTYNLSFEINNVLNALAYDEFNLQKPGRAFYIKLRYFLNNN